jgi:hypothetical protein
LAAAARALVERRAPAAAGQRVEPIAEIEQRGAAFGVLNHLLDREHADLEAGDRTGHPAQVGAPLWIAAVLGAARKPAQVPAADARPRPDGAA